MPKNKALDSLYGDGTIKGDLHRSIESMGSLFIVDGQVWALSKGEEGNYVALLMSEKKPDQEADIIELGTLEGPANDKQAKVVYENKELYKDLMNSLSVEENAKNKSFAMLHRKGFGSLKTQGLSAGPLEQFKTKFAGMMDMSSINPSSQANAWVYDFTGSSVVSINAPKVTFLDDDCILIAQSVPDTYAKLSESIKERYVKYTEGESPNMALGQQLMKLNLHLTYSDLSEETLDKIEELLANSELIDTEVSRLIEECPPISPKIVREFYEGKKRSLAVVKLDANQEVEVTQNGYEDMAYRVLAQRLLIDEEVKSLSFRYKSDGVSESAPGHVYCIIGEKEIKIESNRPISEQLGEIEGAWGELLGKSDRAFFEGLAKIVIPQNGLLLKYVPEDERTLALCEAAVNNNGLALQYVPEDKKPALCEAAFKNNAGAWQYFALHFFERNKVGISVLHIRLMIGLLKVLSLGLIKPLKNTADKLYTHVFYKTAMDNVDKILLANSQAIFSLGKLYPGIVKRYVAYHNQDLIDLYKAGLTKRGDNILDVPEEIRDGVASRFYSKSLQDLNMSRGSVVFGLIKNLDTPEAEKARIAHISQEGYGDDLQDVPEQFKTEDLCLAAVKSEGLAMSYVPEDKITLALCKAAVENNGLALQYVPESMRQHLSSTRLPPVSARELQPDPRGADSSSPSDSGISDTEGNGPSPRRRSNTF